MSVTAAFDSLSSPILPCWDVVVIWDTEDGRRKRKKCKREGKGREIIKSHLEYNYIYIINLRVCNL